MPPILFPATTSTQRRWIAHLKREGQIRPIGPRLYTSVAAGKVADAVRGSWSTIVATLFPRALISHRTALEFKPSPDGEIFITATTNRRVAYPGLTLCFARGPGPLADDPKFLTMRSSSQPRALLENLSTTRRGSRPRTAPIEEVEKRLEQILRVEGEAGLGQVAERARQIARELGWGVELARLDDLIGALLGTRTAKLSSPIARARAVGEPFSPACLERLQGLFGELRGPLVDIPDPRREPAHFTNKAFFEAYFSNYIEGTTFEIEEAEQIVFDHKMPAARPQDAHDIAGTFRITSDPAEMRRTPASFDDLLALLQARHRTMMKERAEVEPGKLKVHPNRAGATHFVDPECVIGTLRKGMALYADLAVGLPRAIFVMFLVSDVHPFSDGNGRIARIMMNAELVRAGRATIIIPTVYRDDHLQALRALTRRNRAAPLVNALLRAQRFSDLEFSSYPDVLRELQRRNWFRDPDEARIID